MEKRFVGSCHAISRNSLEQCNLAGVRRTPQRMRGMGLDASNGTENRDSSSAFHKIDYRYVAGKRRLSLPMSPENPTIVLLCP